MARDYQKEYAMRKDKDKRKILSTVVLTEVAEDFKAKCALDNTTTSYLLKEFVYAYVNGDLTFDGKSIKAQKYGHFQKPSI